jgi:hypothetical protein
MNVSKRLPKRLALLGLLFIATGVTVAIAVGNYCAQLSANCNLSLGGGLVVIAMSISLILVGITTIVASLLGARRRTYIVFGVASVVLGFLTVVGDLVILGLTIHHGT